MCSVLLRPCLLCYCFTFSGHVFCIIAAMSSVLFLYLLRPCVMYSCDVFSLLLFYLFRPCLLYCCHVFSVIALAFPAMSYNSSIFLEFFYSCILILHIIFLQILLHFFYSYLSVLLDCSIIFIVYSYLSVLLPCLYCFNLPVLSLPSVFIVWF